MRFTVVFLSLCCAAALFGADRPAVPVVYAVRGEERPAVQKTGLFREGAAPGISGKAGTPAGVLAARLSRSDVLFEWRPSPRSSLSGSADLMDALLSEDESLLIAAERIGGEGRPNSTRLVFFNLFNGRIANGWELPDRLITHLARIPGHPEQLLAVQAPQECFSAPAALLVLDLPGRKVLHELPAGQEPLRFCCAAGNSVWYTRERSQELFRRKTDGSAPRVLRSRCGEPFPVAAPDGSSVFVCGSGRVEQYETGENSALLNSWPLPEKFRPRWAVPVSSDGKMLLLGAPGESVMLFVQGNCRLLAEKGGAGGCWHPEKNLAVTALQYRNSLQLLQMPEGTLLGNPVRPGSLRPVSRAETFRLFARSGNPWELILLDGRGNLYRLTVSSRLRWSKKALYQTESPAGRR